MTHWRANMNGPASLGGASADRSTYGANSTRADTEFDQREIAAWVFISLCAVSPLVILVLCLAVIRFLS